MCVLQDVDFHPGESPARGRVGKVLYVRAPSHWAPLTLTSASHPLCFFVPLSHSLSPFTLSHVLPPSPLLAGPRFRAAHETRCSSMMIPDKLGVQAGVMCSPAGSWRRTGLACVRMSPKFPCDPWRLVCNGCVFALPSDKPPMHGLCCMIINCRHTPCWFSATRWSNWHLGTSPSHRFRTRSSSNGSVPLASSRSLNDQVRDGTPG